MLRRTTRSTLFPYTTLFRSAKAQDEERQRYCDMLEEEDGKGSVFRVAKQMVGLNKDITASECVKGVDGRTVVDRKSTRLNSSHLGISYAVFCLKKKRECKKT